MSMGDQEAVQMLGKNEGRGNTYEGTRSFEKRKGELLNKVIGCERFR